jgi:hypothetical protein
MISVKVKKSAQVISGISTGFSGQIKNINCHRIQALNLHPIETIVEQRFNRKKSTGDFLFSQRKRVYGYYRLVYRQLFHL